MRLFRYLPVGGAVRFFLVARMRKHHTKWLHGSRYLQTAYLKKEDVDLKCDATKQNQFIFGILGVFFSCLWHSWQINCHIQYLDMNPPHLLMSICSFISLFFSEPVQFVKQFGLNLFYWLEKSGFHEFRGATITPRGCLAVHDFAQLFLTSHQ